MMDTLVRPGDVVGVYVKDEISFYARVEEIDIDQKPGWRQLRLLILAVPLREVTWILEPEQIDGKPFTMGGTALRIERIPQTVPETPHESEGTGRTGQPQGPAKIINFPGKAKK